jgi:hypothetical protein
MAPHFFTFLSGPQCPFIPIPHQQTCRIGLVDGHGHCLDLAVESDAHFRRVVVHRGQALLVHHALRLQLLGKVDEDGRRDKVLALLIRQLVACTKGRGGPRGGGWEWGEL